MGEHHESGNGREITEYSSRGSVAKGIFETVEHQHILVSPSSSYSPGPDRRDRQETKARYAECRLTIEQIFWDVTPVLAWFVDGLWQQHLSAKLEHIQAIQKISILSR